MPRVWLVLTFCATLLAGSALAIPRAGAQSNADSAAVITAFEVARNRKDIDVALSYFSDDAQLTFRNTVYSGRAEIRRFLETPTRTRLAVVSDRRASGNQVTWTERTPGQTTSGQVAGGGSPAGFAVSAEAVVQDGRIQSLTYSLGGPTARADPALEGRAQLPATAGLGAVALILIGLLVVGSLGLRPAAVSASTLRGRMMADLRGWTAARQSP